MMRRATPVFLVLLWAGCGGSTDPEPADWWQWGRAPGHGSAAEVQAQIPARILAQFVLDPFVRLEVAEAGGPLLVHYPVPLIDGREVYVGVKSGRYLPCAPPGSGRPAPCGPAAWSAQIWGVQALEFDGQGLSERWRFDSDWKPTPTQSLTRGWEPVFHPVLTDRFAYAPGASGSLWKLDRDSGAPLERLAPFGESAPDVFLVGPPSADAEGNIYYNALRLDLRDSTNPWTRDALGAWLVRVGTDDQISRVAFDALLPMAPDPDAPCETSFSGDQLPWPPSPSSRPPSALCGSQRPGLNVAPAIAPDGTVYTLSRAHLNPRYSYLVAVHPDLSLKWAASLRDRLSDGCGSDLLPPNGTPGGCREGAVPGVDPATNAPPAGLVSDLSTSSPVVAPDGSVLYGAQTTYNYRRGHLMHFNSGGAFLGAYSFGWDTTPALFRHDGTYSVVLKENNYVTGSYCADPRWCPTEPGGPYRVLQLSAALQPEWTYVSTSGTGARTEWCVNAPVVDADGTVYANNEDGHVYAIGQGGELLGRLFLAEAIGAAYTPLAIGRDGLIYTQNDGQLFVVGE